MFEKIAQIKEYYRLKKNTKLKESEFYEASLDECAAWGKIHKRMQSIEYIVVHRIHEGLFGSRNYPCVVEKISQIPIDESTRLYLNPDKTCPCPKYEENEPCKNSKCMHYSANQAYFIAKKNTSKTWEEFEKTRLARDEARIRAFGRTK